MQAQDFPEVAQAITEAIAELGRAVVPKLNWSCPQAGDGDDHASSLWLAMMHARGCP